MICRTFAPQRTGPHSPEFDTSTRRHVGKVHAGSSRGPAKTLRLIRWSLRCLFPTDAPSHVPFAKMQWRLGSQPRGHRMCSVRGAPGVVRPHTDQIDRDFVSTGRTFFPKTFSRSHRLRPDTDGLDGPLIHALLKTSATRSSLNSSSLKIDSQRQEETPFRCAAFQNMAVCLLLQILLSILSRRVHVINNEGKDHRAAMNWRLRQRCHDRGGRIELFRYRVPEELYDLQKRIPIASQSH